MGEQPGDLTSVPAYSIEVPNLLAELLGEKPVLSPTVE